MTGEIPEQPGRVPVGELRELVDEWREQEYGYVNGKHLYAGCVSDLENVISDYESR